MFLSFFRLFVNALSMWGSTLSMHLSEMNILFSDVDLCINRMHPMEYLISFASLFFSQHFMKFYDLSTFENVYKLVNWRDEKKNKHTKMIVVESDKHATSVDIIVLNFHSNSVEHHLKSIHKTWAITCKFVLAERNATGRHVEIWLIFIYWSKQVWRCV